MVPPRNTVVFAVYAAPGLWSYRTPNPPLDRRTVTPVEDVDWIEFFAGKAEATRMMRKAGLVGLRLDLLYNEDVPSGKQNFMDICTAAGFAFLGSMSVVHAVVQRAACLEHACITAAVVIPRQWGCLAVFIVVLPHLRLGIASILLCKEDKFLVHFGLKCSTWTAVNQGTSSRCCCAATGNTEYESVRQGNLMGARNSGYH